MKIRHFLWKLAKRLCRVREGENITKSHLLPHIAILLNRDKWYWKLWLIKNRCGPDARKAFDQMCKNEFYDYNRLVWKVGPLEIPDELIHTLTQDGIDLAAAQARKENGR